MANTSNKSFSIAITGDGSSSSISWSEVFAGLSNPLSPAQSEVKDLVLGANTITPPTGGGTTPVGVLIIPPSTNANALTLKGVAGDTGVPISKTDITYIGLGATGTFVINAAALTSGVRFIWL
jgi:hypothetical protein